MTKADIIKALNAEKIIYSYEGKTKTFHIEKFTNDMFPKSEFNFKISLFDKGARKVAKKDNRDGAAIDAPRMVISKKGKILAIKFSDVEQL